MYTALSKWEALCFEMDGSRSFTLTLEVLDGHCRKRESVIVNVFDSSLAGVENVEAINTEGWLQALFSPED